VRIVVTGAGGDLGRAFLARAPGHHDVLAFDREALDVGDHDAVRQSVEPLRADVILNFAAYTRVDENESDQARAFRDNALGPQHLALAARASGAVLLHVSTDYVFDGEKGAPYLESDVTRPLSVYGASKLAGEEEVRRANPRHWIVRTAWLYGPVGANFALSIRAAALREPRLRVVDDQWGSPSYAPHLAAALERLVESDAFGTHHLANGGVASRFEFAAALLAALGSGTQLEPIPTSAWPTRARRPRNTALASERRTGIALPDWREGVRAFATAVSAGDGV